LSKDTRKAGLISSTAARKVVAVSMLHYYSGRSQWQFVLLAVERLVEAVRFFFTFCHLNNPANVESKPFCYLRAHWNAC